MSTDHLSLLCELTLVMTHDFQKVEPTLMKSGWLHRLQFGGELFDKLLNLILERPIQFSMRTGKIIVIINIMNTAVNPKILALYDPGLRAFTCSISSFRTPSMLPMRW